MTKKLLILLLALVGLTGTMRADVVINATNFPDANFRTWLQGNWFGTDGIITTAELEQTKSISVMNMSISDLTGINLFTALESLDCSNNVLTSLDVSIPTLKSLTCLDNKLSSIIVSNCPNLEELSCSANLLPAIDVSHNTKLKELYCGVNYISTVNLANNMALETFSCVYNSRLTSIDLSNHTALKRITCYDDGLTSLNITGCSALEEIECYGNKLTTLDLSGKSHLTVVKCYNNQLTSLNLSGCANLTNLECYGNNLTLLNVDGCSNLPRLNCSGNTLTALDISTCPSLTYLNCSNNQLATLTLSSNTGMTILNCGNNQLTSLNVSGLTALTTLSCENNQLTSLNVSNNTALNELSCENNQLSELNVSYNEALNTLSCGNNQLESLDVTYNTALTSLDCSNNQLTLLTLANNAAITKLDCNTNQLESIDVHRLTSLSTLYCRHNLLTSLNVASNIALQTLDCEYNRLTVLDVTANYRLATIQFGHQTISKTGIVLEGKVYAEINDQAVLSCISNLKAYDSNSVGTNLSPLFYSDTSWLIANETDEAVSYLTYSYDTGYGLMNVRVDIDHIEDAIPIDAAHFPDAIFRNFLLTQKYGKDGLLTQTEIADIKDMDVSNRGIEDLTGIQYFTALEILDCSRNNLTQLNVSALTLLESFNCWENSLTSINVSALTKLTMLGLEDNNLTSLNVLALTQLRDLAVSNNQLTSIDVTHNTALRGLVCDGNQLQTLDLTANTQLGTLYCQDNALTAISLPANSRLRYFYCYQNQLTGEALDDIIAALPTLTSASNLRIYYDNASNEGNEVTSKQVKQLAQKGWTAKHYDGSAWVNYAGLPLSYDLWLRGHQVTSTNCNNLTALAGVSGTVASFNELTNTLTLGDVTIISSGITPEPGIESNIDGLTINVVGTNNINMTDTTAIVLKKNATIKGPGTLTAQSSSSNGIYIYGGTLSVTGGVTLNAVANSAPATTKTGFGIYGRTVARLDPRGGGTTISYYGSLAVGSDSTKVQSIGSMASVAALDALTYPTGSTLKVVNPSTSSEVNGYFRDHNVCTRSGSTYTLATALVRIITPDTQTGDVNGDGFVNELDVAALADMLVGNTPFSDTADVDANGTVSLADLTTLVNMVK